MSLAKPLTGQVAIVTGSTRGIGLASAYALGRAGATVVVSSRTQAACDRAVAVLRSQGVEATGVACHIGKAEQRSNLLEEAERIYGRLDILVCNAAVNPVFATLEETSEEAWAKVLSTNLTAIWALTSLAAPLLERRGGTIVAVSSLAGSFVAPLGGAYGVSKAAVNHLVRQLAYELAPRGIRVNAVAPAAVRTDMIRAALADAELSGVLAANNPLGRLAEPEDIAHAIVFLASPNSRQITGQILVIDGGESLTTR